MISKLTRRQLFYALNASAIAIAAGCSQSRDRQNLFSLADSGQLNDLRLREATLQDIAKEKGFVYGSFPEAICSQLDGDTQFQSQLVGGMSAIGSRERLERALS